MQVLPAKRREENCTERYLRGSRNRNGEHLANICESKTHQSVFYQVLNEVSDGVFSEKRF